MRTHAKPTIHVNETDRIVTTIFEDGATLHAAPNEDEESMARANALGYTDGRWVPDAIWAMTKDHERLHHLVAEALGDDHSIALWYAAHPDEQMSEAEQHQANNEERIVLLIQRLLNQGLDHAVS
jgi:hypothetical protein